MRERVRDFRRRSSRTCVITFALPLVALVAVRAGAHQPGAVAAADEYVAHLEAYASGHRDQAVAGVLPAARAPLLSAQDTAFDRMDQRVAAAFDNFRRGRASRERFDVERAARVRGCKLALALHVEAVAVVQTGGQIDAQFGAATSAITRIVNLEEDLERNGPVFDLEWRHLAAAGTVQMNQDEQTQRARRESHLLRGLVRQAYLTLASFLQDRGILEPLETLLDDALDLIEDDPALLLARGSYRESVAAQMVVDASLSDRIYPADHRRRRRTMLDRAEADLQEAWTRAPDLIEAVLRLGRVRQLQGHTSEARRAFDTVGRQPAGPHLRYLALMFRADLAEQDGDTVSAERLYRESLAVMPVAQAPSLALSRMADRRGDVRDARRWLQRSLVAVGPERDDPWWAYARGQGRLFGERLEQLRVMALR